MKFVHKFITLLIVALIYSCATKKVVKTNSIYTLKTPNVSNSITAIKNKNDVLPIKDYIHTKLAVAIIGRGDTEAFEDMLSNYMDYHIEYIGETSDIKHISRKLESYNTLIVYNGADIYNKNNLRFSEKLDSLLQTNVHKNIILCNPSNNLFVKNYMDKYADAILISNNDDEYHQQNLAQAIFGGINVSGRLPNSLGKKYKKGFGINIPKIAIGYLRPEEFGLNFGDFYKIDSICEYAIKEKATPGCEVLIAKDGYILYNKAFGYHTYEKDYKNRVDDIYDIASITKISASLPAIMRLYDEAKIKLNTPISKYIRKLKNTNKKDITIKELLVHQAGLIPFIPIFTESVFVDEAYNPFSRTKKDDNYYKLDSYTYIDPEFKFKDGTISTIPRKDYYEVGQGLFVGQGFRDTIFQRIINSRVDTTKAYKYSDLDFILLQNIVENISGKTLDKYAKENFYNKIGLRHTDFNPLNRFNVKNIIPSTDDKIFRKRIVRGVVHDPMSAVMNGVAGHAGLFSTATDLAKLMQLYINYGEYGGYKYFKKETIKKFTSQSNEYPQNRRGLGFDKPEPDPLKGSPFFEGAPLSGFGHSGFTGTMAWADPQNGIIYIFLSNRTFPDEFNGKLINLNIRTEIQKYIYEILVRK